MTVVYSQLAKQLGKIEAICNNCIYHVLPGDSAVNEVWVTNLTRAISDAVSLAQQTDRQDVAFTLCGLSEVLSCLNRTWDRSDVNTNIENREIANRKNWQKLYEITTCLGNYASVESTWFVQAGEPQRWAKQLKREWQPLLAAERAMLEAAQPA